MNVLLSGVGHNLRLILKQLSGNVPVFCHSILCRIFGLKQPLAKQNYGYGFDESSVLSSCLCFQSLELNASIIDLFRCDQIKHDD